MSTPAETKYRFMRKSMIAMRAGRVEEGRQAAKIAVETGVELTEAEAKTLTAVYYSSFSARAASFYLLRDYAKSKELSEDEQKDVGELGEKILQETRELLNEANGLLDTILIPNTTKPLQKLRYLAMKIECSTQLGLICPAYNKTGVKDLAEAYEEAYQITLKELPPTHIVRLLWAAEYSNFCYDVLKDEKKAKEIANKAIYDTAAVCLASFDDEDLRTMTEIMNLINGLLDKWEKEKKDGKPPSAKKAKMSSSDEEDDNDEDDEP